MQKSLLTVSADSADLTQRRTTLSQLAFHPGHDRKRYDIAKLANLTLQVAQRGINNWQQIHAAEIADQPERYHIISGHRRYIACVLACGVHEWSQLPERQAELADGGITVDFVAGLIRQMVTTFNGTDTSGATTLTDEQIQQTLTPLLQLYGSQEVTISLHVGDAKSQMLALISANGGHEEPDAQGLANAYEAAYAAGATPAEIARHAGVTLDHVLSHLALCELPPVLTNAIADGRISFGIARVIGSAPVNVGDGMAKLVIDELRSAEAAQQKFPLTVQGLKQAERRLKNWPGLVMPLTGFHKQTQRNIARVLISMWQACFAHSPTLAWKSAVHMAYHDLLADPWLDATRTKTWIGLLDFQYKYLRLEYPETWRQLVIDHLHAITCHECPLHKLPNVTLQSDIGEQRAGPAGFPCRTRPDKSHPGCLQGYAPNDPLSIPVPLDWSQHTGVIQQNGGYIITNADVLLSAWQAQQAEETATAAEPEPVVNEPVEIISSAEPSDTSTSSPTAEAAKPAQPKQEPLSQRQLRYYIDTHAQLQTGHPFATPCSRCQHRLDASPVKSRPNAPHCRWAKGRPTLNFSKLTPTVDDTSFTDIPVCHQFAPLQSWQDSIPTYPQPVPLPRQWLIKRIEQQIGQMERAAQQQHGSVPHYAFEFLTGRPLSAKESHRDWLRSRFAAERGELSTAQLMTLFIWTFAELARLQRKAIPLPVNGQSAQFIDVKPIVWEVPDDN